MTSAPSMPRPRAGAGLGRGPRAVAERCGPEHPRGRLMIYKLALLTWVGAYALITLILAVLGPTMAAWPPPLRTLLLSATMVTALKSLVLPALTRIFRGWLARTYEPDR
jgi:antibiotic biosynthesis monooxygenase (ABM) superfamily enzyme